MSASFIQVAGKQIGVADFQGLEKKTKIEAVTCQIKKLWDREEKTGGKGTFHTQGGVLAFAGGELRVQFFEYPDVTHRDGTWVKIEGPGLSVDNWPEEVGNNRIKVEKGATLTAIEAPKDASQQANGNGGRQNTSQSASRSSGRKTMGATEAVDFMISTARRLAVGLTDIATTIGDISKPTWEDIRPFAITLFIGMNDGRSKYDITNDFEGGPGQTEVSDVPEKDEIQVTEEPLREIMALEKKLGVERSDNLKAALKARYDVTSHRDLCKAHAVDLHAMLILIQEVRDLAFKLGLGAEAQIEILALRFTKENYFQMSKPQLVELVQALKWRLEAKSKPSAEVDDKSLL